MALELVTPPATEPVSLDEAKEFMRILHTDEDALIQNLIVVARRQCEELTGFALLTQTWNWILDAFPKSPAIVPKPPLKSVDSITYIDPGGIDQTVPDTDYILDTASTPGRISLAYGKSWPSPQSIINAVTIRFVAGHDTAAEVQDEKKHGILLMVSNLYEHRETIFPGHVVGEYPLINQLWFDRIFYF